MIYLDTGCLVKLYYPEPESSLVAQLVAGHAIVFTPLHELEISNAFELKLFRKEARPAQVKASRVLIQQDLAAGTLHRPALRWEDVLAGSTALALRHTRKIGCRSLDILHCAAAQLLSAAAFVSSDARQRRLAISMGLECPSV